MKKWLLMLVALLLTTNVVAAAGKLDAKTYKTKKTALQKQLNQLSKEAESLYEKAYGGEAASVPDVVVERFAELPVRSKELRGYYEEVGREIFTEKQRPSFLSKEDHTRFENAQLAIYHALHNSQELGYVANSFEQAVAVDEKQKNYSGALKSLQQAVAYFKKLKAANQQLMNVRLAEARLLMELDEKYPAKNK